MSFPYGENYHFGKTAFLYWNGPSAIADTYFTNQTFIYETVYANVTMLLYCNPCKTYEEIFYTAFYEPQQMPKTTTAACRHNTNDTRLTSDKYSQYVMACWWNYMDTLLITNDSGVYSGHKKYWISHVKELPAVVVVVC